MHFLIKNDIPISDFNTRSDDSALRYLQQLLPTVVTLLQCDGSVDQARAVLSYIRVTCSLLPTEVLSSESVLIVIVPAFTISLAQRGHKQKFSSRCRAIMRKLVSRIGSDDIRIYLPEEDIPLLEYVCRQNRRTERRKAALKDKNKRLDRMMGSDSDDDSDFDEDGDDDEERGMEVEADTRPPPEKRRFLTAARPRAVPAASASSSSALPSSLSDLLEDYDPRHPGKVAAGPPSAEENDEDEDFRVIVTPEGMVMVKEKEVVPEAGNSSHGKKRGRDDQDGSNNEDSSKIVATKPQDNSARKKSKLALKEPGIEYRSNKAGGDVMKKGMLEPHAFIPLDARLLSKKNYKEAVSHFGVVVKGRNKKAAQQKRKGGRKFSKN